MKKTVIKSLILFGLAPVMFLCFLVTTALLMLLYPTSVLLLVVFLLPKVNSYLVEANLSFLTMVSAGILALSKKPLIWKKPEDRILIVEQPLVSANLI